MTKDEVTKYFDLYHLKFANIIFRYHLGTIAFGSIILALTKFIRAILDYFDKKFGVSNNSIIKFIMRLLFYVLWAMFYLLFISSLSSDFLVQWRLLWIFRKKYLLLYIPKSGMSHFSRWYLKYFHTFSSIYFQHICFFNHFTLFLSLMVLFDV